jgi:hypothetical protein
MRSRFGAGQHEPQAGPAAEFPDGDGPMSDALTYADQTVGPAGEPLDWRRRYAEMLRRQGPDSWKSCARRTPISRLSGHGRP